MKWIINKLKKWWNTGTCDVCGRVAEVDYSHDEFTCQRCLEEMNQEVPK